MAKFDIFIGRYKELEQIRFWADKSGTVHHILVEGPGGVGKTFLLQKVMQEYLGKDGFAIDYYDFAEQPPGGVREAVHLAESLGRNNFPGFYKKLAELAKGKLDIADPGLVQLETDTLQTCLRELNDFLSHTRLIRITDTIEATLLLDPVRKQNLFEDAQCNSNILFIAAGRTAGELFTDFQRKFGYEHVTLVRVEGFDSIEASEFFARMDEDGLIPQELRSRLHLLARGRPILLTLATEWSYHQVPLPEIDQYSLDDLLSLSSVEFDTLAGRFEFELVDRIRQLQRPLDQAVLYLAHISRRCDVRLLSILLDTSLDVADNILKQLVKLPFVKYHHGASGTTCKLHDEMNRLVNLHVWPYVDPMGKVRQKLTSKVIAQYYEPRLNELAEQVMNELADQVKAGREPSRGPISRAIISNAEWALWLLEAECLHYQLQNDKKQGMAYFNERFWDAQRNNHLIRIRFLLSEIEGTGETRIPDAVELHRAEFLRLGGNPKQARAICERILAKAQTSLDNRVGAHATLGLIAASSHPKRAERHFVVALRFAQERNDPRLVGVLHNNLGQLHISLNQHDQAGEHLDKAIACGKQANDKVLLAAATNNLAYVYGQQGRLPEADALCRFALALRRDLAHERDLSFSYLTKAEIDLEKGDLESAEHYTKLALQVFDKLNDARGQAQAYRSLANTHRHLEQYEEAERYLEEGISLAKQIGDLPSLASLLNIYGREQRSQALHFQEFGGDNNEKLAAGLFDSALGYLQQSLDLAQRYGDVWLATRCQFEQLLVYHWSRNRSDDAILESLPSILQIALQANDRLLEGYVHDLQGLIALGCEDYAEAARQFGLAVQIISREAGREAQRFFDRVDDRLLNSHLPSSAISIMAQGILSAIDNTKESSQHLRSLRLLCQQILDLRGINKGGTS